MLSLKAMKSFLKKALASRRVATHSLQRPTVGGALVSMSEVNRALLNTNTEAFIPAFLPVSTEARGSSSLSVSPLESISISRDSEVKTASQRRIQNRASSRMSLSLVGKPKSAKQKKSLARNLVGLELQRAKRFFQGDLIKLCSKAAYESRLRTCQGLCRDDCGVCLELLPLTQEKVTLICARLKEAAYKSADRYLGAYKLHHDLEREDLPFSKGMSLFYARALRSLRLGMGAKKRASTFDVRAVARIASTVRSVASTAPCVKRGPFAPLNSLIAATCFALREVESSSLGLWHFLLNFLLRVVSVTFVDAKTSLFLQDIKQGCSDPGKRDVPCTLASVCPFCSMARLVQAATDLHRSRGVSEDDLLDQPLFPAADGSPVGPWPWLESLRAVVACAGSRMIDATGDQVFTRHSLRRSSLKMLVDAGATIRQTTAISRHTGASVLDYLSGTDAVDTTVVAALLNKKFLPSSVLPVCPDAVKMSMRPMDRWRCIEFHEPYKYFVVNTKTDKIHGVLDLSQIKTRCGFLFACCPFTDILEVLDKDTKIQALCGSCFG